MCCKQYVYVGLLVSRRTAAVINSVSYFLCHFQPSYKQCTPNCGILVTTVCCTNNGLLLEILLIPRIRKFWFVIQVSVFYFSVTITDCFTGYLQI